VHERVSLTLSSGRVSVSAGEAPSIVDVTLSNRSQVVDQFDIAVSGGQPDWYDVTPNRVSLFPGETTTVRLALHPPRREDVLAGKYEIVVRAISRDATELASIAGLEMTIVPSGGFDLQLPKARDEGRSGRYRLHITSLSDAPLALTLEPSDPETALTFFFPAVRLDLAPYEERDIDFTLQPSKRRLKGDPRHYPFNIEATPQIADRARAAREAKKAQGEFIYRPRFQRWPWQGLPALVNVVVPSIAAVAALSAVLVASGAVGGKDTPPTPEPPNIAATLTARDVAASSTAAAVNAAASATAAAANAASSATAVAVTATAIATLSVTPTPAPMLTGTPTLAPTGTPTRTATPRPIIGIPIPSPIISP
jgi:hypothetical protein